MVGDDRGYWGSRILEPRFGAPKTQVCYKIPNYSHFYGCWVSWVKIENGFLVSGVTVFQGILK